ncbi:hypothetical protein HNQ69_001304 [Bartonella callosciuri]|uniref:Uncharacterized protein n=1 Tax=Bartonella callosciuri TaxID=686223 RepID=A0A840P1K1_9HYPH|nr:hypothetical protein [Bartonella callosciuri]
MTDTEYEELRAGGLGTPYKLSSLIMISEPRERE